MSPPILKQSVSSFVQVGGIAKYDSGWMCITSAMVYLLVLVNTEHLLRWFPLYGNDNLKQIKTVKN